MGFGSTVESSNGTRGRGGAGATESVSGRAKGPEKGVVWSGVVRVSPLIASQAEKISEGKIGDRGAENVPPAVWR